MNKTFILLSLFLSACAGSGSSNSGGAQTLISYNKYDFVNATYVTNNDGFVISLYQTGMSLSKTGCDTTFFQASNTSLPAPGDPAKTIQGVNNGNSSCFPNQVNIEITNENKTFSNKASYSVKFLSDMYEMILK